MAVFIGRSSCDHCGSKDNGAIYDDGGFHCFGCGFTIPSEEYRKDKGSGFKKSRPKIVKAVEKEQVVSNNNARSPFFGIPFVEVFNTYKELNLGNIADGRFVYDLFVLSDKFNRIAGVEPTVVIICDSI